MSDQTGIFWNFSAGLAVLAHRAHILGGPSFSGAQSGRPTSLPPSGQGLVASARPLLVSITKGHSLGKKFGNLFDIHYRIIKGNHQLLDEMRSVQHPFSKTSSSSTRFALEGFIGTEDRRLSPERHPAISFLRLALFIFIFSLHYCLDRSPNLAVLN